MAAEAAADGSAALANLRQRLDRVEREGLQPPPELTLSQWAERHFRLSRESSAQTGRFRPWGFQRGMLDAVTDPQVERISVMKSTRLGYTKLLNAAVGYFIHQDPSPILVVNPRSQDDVQRYNNKELEPMLRDSPVLAELVGARKGKDPSFTVRSKLFRNGASVTLLGANSPAEMRAETARVVAFDEVDEYPISADQGDPIDLGEERTKSFWNRKIITGGTPTVKGESRIEKAWEESDQRHYYVPCPHCREEQVLEFGSNKPHGLRWPKDAHGEPRPEEAYYVCAANGCVIDERDKPWMIENGRWVAHRPERAGHAGFHISALYSLQPNARWSVIAREFLERKDFPDRLQTFVNTTLGETWEPPADREIDEYALMARREVYAAEVPAGVALLTMGVDTQPDRLEAEIVGWGWDEESWSIDHQVLPGDPNERDVWERLDAIRLKTWRCADGRQLKVDAACVDTGGHNTQAAYRYGIERVSQNVWPIKGRGKRSGANAAQRGLVFQGRPKSQRRKAQTSPYLVDVDTAKDTIFPRLAKEPPGPVTCHFPAHYERAYFDQLTAEKPVKEVVHGQTVWRWHRKSGRNNEALDLRVYAYAALCALQQAGVKLNEHAQHVGATRPQDREPIQYAKDTAGPVQAAPEMPQRPPEQPTQPRSPRRRRRARMAMR